MVKLEGWILLGGRRGGSPLTLLEVETRDDGQDVRCPHLGLTSAHGGHFRFGQLFCSRALLQGVDDHLKIRLGHNSGYRSNRRSAVSKAARQALNRGWNGIA